MKAMLIVIMSMLYFILYFAVSSSTIYNLVVILIMIIVVVVLSIMSLINYFSVQEECDKIIDESLDEKMSSMYSGTIDSLPGEVGAVTEEVLDSMENIEIEDLDFDALISDKIEELKKEDKNDEN